MATVGVDGSSLQANSQPKSVWLGLRVGSRLARSRHSSNKPSELSEWLCHGDSTINIGIGIHISILILLFSIICNGL